MKTRCLPKRRAKASSITPPRPRVLFASSGDTQSVSSCGAETSTSNRKELTEHLWRQLAEDIEAEGGISAFVGSSQKLASLLNQRPGLYGNRGDEIREPIRKKVYRWQQFNKENTYANKVLSKYQVKSAFHRKQEELQKRKSLSSGGKKNETKSVVQNSTPGRLPYRQPNNKTTATRRSTTSAPKTAAFGKEDDRDKEDTNDSYSLSSSSSSSSSGNSGGSSIHSVSSIPQQKRKNKKPRLQGLQQSSEVDNLLSSAVASLLNISSSVPSATKNSNKRKSPPSSKKTLVQPSPSRPAQQFKMPPTKVPAGKRLPDDGTGTTIDSGPG